MKIFIMLDFIMSTLGITREFSEDFPTTPAERECGAAWASWVQRWKLQVVALRIRTQEADWFREQIARLQKRKDGDDSRDYDADLPELRLSSYWEKNVPDDVTVSDDWAHDTVPEPCSVRSRPSLLLSASPRINVNPFPLT